MASKGRFEKSVNEQISRVEFLAQHGEKASKCRFRGRCSTENIGRRSTFTVATFTPIQEFRSATSEQNQYLQPPEAFITAFLKMAENSATSLKNCHWQSLLKKKRHHQNKNAFLRFVLEPSLKPQEHKNMIACSCFQSHHLNTQQFD